MQSCKGHRMNHMMGRENHMLKIDTNSLRTQIVRQVLRWSNTHVIQYHISSSSTGSVFDQGPTSFSLYCSGRLRSLNFIVFLAFSSRLILASSLLLYSSSSISLHLDFLHTITSVWLWKVTALIKRLLSLLVAPQDMLFLRSLWASKIACKGFILLVKSF